MAFTIIEKFTNRKSSSTQKPYQKNPKNMDTFVKNKMESFFANQEGIYTEHTTNNQVVTDYTDRFFNASTDAANNKLILTNSEYLIGTVVSYSNDTATNKVLEITGATINFGGTPASNITIAAATTRSFIKTETAVWRQMTV